jgi:uncharacterized protein YqcC (DUF446 family)
LRRTVDGSLLRLRGHGRGSDYDNDNDDDRSLFNSFFEEPLTQTNPYLALLAELEEELRRQGQWETAPPPPEAFESRLPFSCDTLRFTQWLQWVFIPRTHALISAGGPMPARSAIRAMAEEVLGGCPWSTETVVTLLSRFDQMINLDVR